MAEEKTTDLIVCDCYSPDHQLIIRYDKEDDEAYIHYHLVNRSFWSRVKYGIKYIFGYKSRYGAFDEVVLGRQHAEKFKKLAEFLEKIPISSRS